MSAPTIVAVELAVGGAGLGEGQADAAGIRDLVGVAQQRAARAVLLDAAALTAAAGQPAGHDAQVADLARRAESAAQQAAVGDHGAADAGADGEHGHVGRPAAAPKRYSAQPAAFASLSIVMSMPGRSSDR